MKRHWLNNDYKIVWWSTSTQVLLCPFWQLKQHHTCASIQFLLAPSLPHKVNVIVCLDWMIWTHFSTSNTVLCQLTALGLYAYSSFNSPLGNIFLLFSQNSCLSLSECNSFCFLTFNISKSLMGCLVIPWLCVVLVVVHGCTVK